MARDVSGQANLVYGMAPNIESRGSCEMYVLARRGRGVGLQCITRFMLKQWCKVSEGIWYGLGSDGFRLMTPLFFIIGCVLW